VAKYPFSKGRVVPVESEHSAMGVSIGAALAGARAFTASSSNGLAYMVENIMVAGFYRLPIVMIAVNRTLGPPWNIWADQGDTLMLRDFPWIQFYAETNQEVLDTTLLSFRLAEDDRILLPALVAMDAFIVSHTQGETALPEQGEVDRYLPTLDLPHRLRWGEARTLGGLMWPDHAMSLRLEIDQAMHRVLDVYEECRAEFIEVFGRDPGAPIETFHTEDADRVLIVSGSIASTARAVVRARREAGDNVGLIKMKMFRPFPEAAILEACQGCAKVGVLDRNYAAGMGGVFWQDTRAAFQGKRDDLLIQDYLTGMCGGDVTPVMVDQIITDLTDRDEAGRPVWMGIGDGAGNGKGVAS
jgi:pyruvate/2-oxoacid:ferredoxin oxidoreductase alpha subunit